MAAQYRFDDFLLDTGEWRLTRDGELVDVQQKVLDLLAVFCRDPGALHSREALHRVLWPDTRVSEDALFQVVRKARSALGDQPKTPRFVETVPGRGYRFVADVSEGAEVAVAAPPKPVVYRLPVERDTFVGRTADVETVQQRFGSGSRLVTLHGPGGTGKTRLAIRLGWRLQERFPGGVAFCDLSEARSAEGVVHAVARTLDVPVGDDADVRLGRRLAARGPTLWILDNAEQVAEAVAALATRWLDEAPEASLLVTSREVLAVPGEDTVSLAPLEPADAVAMFSVRAAAVRRDFALTDDNRDAVAELVELLDRLPLAIELAAARVRVWSPQTLLDRMSDRFRVLAAGGRRRDRQATLQATLDWGWALLDEGERVALSQLAVFEGGFDLDAAEAVLELDAGWAMDVVQGLVDKSWVQPVDHDRMQLLLSVQDYVSAKSPDSSSAKRRHAGWFASFVDHRLGDLAGYRERDELQRLLLDFDNLEAATRRSIAMGEFDLATRCLWVLTIITKFRGPARLVGTLSDALLEAGATSRDARAVAAVAFDTSGRTAQALSLLRELRSDGPASMAGNLDNRIALVLFDLGELDEARERAEAALAWADDRGDVPAKGSALTTLGIVAAQRAEPDAEAKLLAALEHSRTHQRMRTLSSALNNLALLAIQQSDADAGRRHASEGLAVARMLGEMDTESALLANLGLLEQQLGDPKVARSHYVDSLRIAREVGNRTTEGNVLANLGSLEVQLGELEAAEVHLRRAHAIHADTGHPATLGFVEGYLGQLHVARGEVDSARACFASAIVLLEKHGDPRGHSQFLGELAELERSQGALKVAVSLLERSVAILEGGGSSYRLGQARALLEAWQQADGSAD